MMLWIEVADLMTAVLQMPPTPQPSGIPTSVESLLSPVPMPSSSPSQSTAALKPSESGEITPTGLLTVGVAVVAGVLSALGTAWVQNLRAKHERRTARMAALWNYHRALTDLSATVDKFYGEDLEIYEEEKVHERLATARNEAYPHFYVFPKKDRGRLRFPTIKDYYQPKELQDQVDKAIKILEGYLDKHSKE